MKATYPINGRSSQASVFLALSQVLTITGVSQSLLIKGDNDSASVLGTVTSANYQEVWGLSEHTGFLTLTGQTLYFSC